jgi:hypothetical protein
VTVTLAGTPSADNPLLLRVTTAPLGGAAFDSVTLQLLLAFAPKVAGLHWSADNTAVAAKLKFTVCEAPL